jgi:hypothetical protein
LKKIAVPNIDIKIVKGIKKYTKLIQSYTQEAKKLAKTGG